MSSSSSTLNAVVYMTGLILAILMLFITGDSFVTFDICARVGRHICIGLSKHQTPVHMWQGRKLSSESCTMGPHYWTLYVLVLSALC